jgi:hypothetical protein
VFDDPDKGYAGEELGKSDDARGHGEDSSNDPFREAAFYSSQCEPGFRIGSVSSARYAEVLVSIQ